MKKKGFVLMETIVVIVVISVSLLTIFSSYNKILRKVKAENKYDTSEYIYMTEYVKTYLIKYMDQGLGCNEQIYEMGKADSGDRTKILKNYLSTNCGFSNDEVNKYTHPFGIKGIYLVQYLTEVDEDTDKPDLEKFDAYMIDYIRKLDVGVNDKLIIVEYQRPALKTNGEQKKDSLGNDLYETYIASLEW